MSHRQTLLSIAGFGLFAVLATSPASGVPIALVDNDATSANAHYSTDQNANIGVSYSATDAINNTQGTLTINTTWGSGDFASRSILFEQTALPTGDFETDEGLRLQLVFSLGNSTGSLWDGFEVRTMDGSVPATVGPDIGGQGAHLFTAHFHPSTGGINIAGGLTTVNSFSNKQLIELSGGTSGDLIVTNFFLHERNLQDGNSQAVQRKFTLLLTPHAVPEPASWALLLIGGLMLATRRNGMRTT